MKPVMVAAMAVVLGASAGAGGAFAVTVLAPGGAPSAAKAEAEPPGERVWVTLEPLTVPVTAGDGAFMGYMVVRTQVRMDAALAEDAKDKLPNTLHAINSVAWRSPLGLSERTGALDVEAMRAIVLTAARKTLGSGVSAAVVTGVEAG